MRRAGSWILGAVVVAAMAGGAWVAFRPLLNRQTLRIAYVVVAEARPPSSDAMISGARFAVEEMGERAGGYRIEFLAPFGPSDPPADILITLDDRGHLLQAEFPDEARRLGDPPPRASVFFRPLANLEDQGSSAAKWAHANGFRRPVVLVDKDHPSSDRICSGFIHGAPYEPFRLVALDTALGREHLLRQVLAAAPDLVFYSGEAAPYRTASELFDALRKQGYAGRLLVGDADPEVSYLAVPTRFPEGTSLVSQILPPSKEFAAAYEPATGRLAGPHAWPAYCLMKQVLGIIDQDSSQGVFSMQSAVSGRKWDDRFCALYVFQEGKFRFVQALD